MAVLGLFSLVGCSNASGDGGSGDGSSSTNTFVGAWENENYGTLTFSASGTVSNSALLPTAGGATYKYTVDGSTAIINWVVAGTSTRLATATLNGETLTFHVPGSLSITFTKQTSSSTKK